MPKKRRKVTGKDTGASESPGGRPRGRQPSEPSVPTPTRSETSAEAKAPEAASGAVKGSSTDPTRTRPSQPAELLPRDAPSGGESQDKTTVASSPPASPSSVGSDQGPVDEAAGDELAGEDASGVVKEPAWPEPPKDVETPSEDEVVDQLPEVDLGPSEDESEAQDPEPVSYPSTPSMFVMMVTPELAPVAKVGGLADVVFGLARELEIRGNAVEIILPKYDCMRYDHIWGLTMAYQDLWVPWYNGHVHCSVWFGFVHGRKVFFIEPHSRDNFFNRGVYYGHSDDLERFAFFSRAALEFTLKSGKNPDIIHCHDWQTGLVPVLLYEIYQHHGLNHPRACFTIHNFKHQGVTGEAVLRATGLNRPEHFFHYDRLRDNHNPSALNLMKGGIVYSNFVTTVSPTHATEAKDGGQGHGMEPTLHVHHYKFGGVLNGLDYHVYNPEIDPRIPVNYSIDQVQKKYENKRALRQQLWIADNERPIVAFIGRLDPQKGLDLVRHGIFYALEHRAQFVLLGSSPDPGINRHFQELKGHLNDHPEVHLEIGFNEELSHLIYAGADMMLVPSRFEPCGLTQLISLRYGTVPVVRAVGGLVDTVFDKDYSHRPLHERNGFVFETADYGGVESGLHRAICLYYDYPDHFRELMLNGMRADYSWNHPGQHYLNIYDYVRNK